jgi:GMP synthase (glutamine-hydrolysing)
MRIHYLQHEDSVSLGSIAQWLLKSGHVVTGTRFQEGDPLPSLENFDGLIVVGGSMSTYQEDEFPWLKLEKSFIRRSIDAGKRVLGLCLGAQLIADALGKKVYRNSHLEVGWFDIHRLPEAAEHQWADLIPTSAEVFHWHGDTFELPDGAVRLASSEACVNQAYAYGNNVLALQFHLETTPAEAQGWIEKDIAKLVEGPFTQSPTQMLKAPERFDCGHQLLNAVLNRIFGAVQIG